MGICRKDLSGRIRVYRDARHPWVWLVSGLAKWLNDPHRLLSKRSSRRWGLRKESLSMSQKKISSGVVHEVPADLKRALTSDPQALTAWEDITPLARNEWICWIESAKKAETRGRRIEWGCSSLKDGKRRPCCWPGCAHR